MPGEKFCDEWTIEVVDFGIGNIPQLQSVQILNHHLKFQKIGILSTDL